jgi:DNA-binding response OmpR family regulator
MIKRYRGSDKDNKITISSRTLDLVKRSVTVNGEIVKLSNTDFELLSYLMQNKGIILSRELILTRVWGYDFEGDTRVVDND